MDKSIKIEKKNLNSLASNTEHCNSLVLAASNLVQQLDLMRKDESYQNVFVLAAVNYGVIYNGPTFNIELDRLKRELSRYRLSI